jgi:transcriptional regulator with XRE-family HTH domain
MKLIFDRIKELREQTGMSARKFAEIIGIKYTTYYGYESGTREPGSQTVTKICNYFGCTADYLLGLSDDPKGYFDEKETSPAPAKAETEEVEKWLTDLLVERGYIRPGEDISDRDAEFLIHWIGLLDAWFEKE